MLSLLSIRHFIVVSLKNTNVVPVRAWELIWFVGLVWGDTLYFD